MNWQLYHSWSCIYSVSTFASMCNVTKLFRMLYPLVVSNIHRIMIFSPASYENSNVSLLKVTILIQTEISQQLLDGTQIMNTPGWSHCQTFAVVPPWNRQLRFWVSWKLLDRLPWNLVQTKVFKSGWIWWSHDLHLGSSSSCQTKGNVFTNYLQKLITLAAASVLCLLFEIANVSM